MHRYIMNAKETLIVVDHEDHNGLNNKKENLRMSDISSNLRNREDTNCTNNSSKCRNVSKVGKWWYVQMQIEGKNTLLKKFPLNKLKEANKYAKKMREKYYGEYAGN